MASVGTLYRQDAGSVGSCTVDITGVVAGDTLFFLAISAGNTASFSTPSGWTAQNTVPPTYFGNHKMFTLASATGSETSVTTTITNGADFSLGYVLSYHKLPNRAGVSVGQAANGDFIGMTDPWSFSMFGVGAPASGWQRSKVGWIITCAQGNLPTSKRCQCVTEPAGVTTLGTSWAKANAGGLADYDFDFFVMNALNQTTAHNDTSIQVDMFPSGSITFAQLAAQTFYIDEELPSVQSGGFVPLEIPLRRVNQRDLPNHLTSAAADSLPEEWPQ